MSKIFGVFVGLVYVIFVTMTLNILLRGFSIA
jgi:hypothetical protein